MSISDDRAQLLIDGIDKVQTMDKIKKNFFIAILVSLSLAPLSSVTRAEEMTPLDKIQAAVDGGRIPGIQGALQQTYYLMGDDRYHEDAFGKEPTTAAGRYDCSSTFVQRRVAARRAQDRNFDPYGMLWKPWVEEADRLMRQGEVAEMGSIGETPVVLYHPQGRFHRRMPKYRTLALVLSRFLREQEESLVDLGRMTMGKRPIAQWSQDLSWPPVFLQNKGPYLNSYFDDHPQFNAGDQKKWFAYRKQLLASVIEDIQEESPHEERSPAWIWLLSDRVRRHTLVWDPEGDSLLFLSAHCLDRVLGGRWRDKAEWHNALKESVAQEILSAFLLNSRNIKYSSDPWLEALVQALVPQLTDQRGPLLRHTPLFSRSGGLSLKTQYDRSFDRLAAAPLWYYFLQVEGNAVLKNYLATNKNREMYLAKRLQKKFRQDSHWLSFALWSLSLKALPASLSADVPAWSAAVPPLLPKDLMLDDVEPPRGTIGSLDKDLAPNSIRYMSFPIRHPKDVEALRVRWKPVAKQLDGYLILTRSQKNDRAEFIDLAPIKPGLPQEVFFDTENLPTEAVFVILHRGDDTYPANEVQLQVTVLPRKVALDSDRP